LAGEEPQVNDLAICCRLIAIYAVASVGLWAIGYATDNGFIIAVAVIAALPVLMIFAGIVGILGLWALMVFFIAEVLCCFGLNHAFAYSAGLIIASGFMVSAYDDNKESQKGIGGERGFSPVQLLIALLTYRHWASSNGHQGNANSLW